MPVCDMMMLPVFDQVCNRFHIRNRWECKLQEARRECAELPRHTNELAQLPRTQRTRRRRRRKSVALFQRVLLFLSNIMLRSLFVRAILHFHTTNHLLMIMIIMSNGQQRQQRLQASIEAPEERKEEQKSLERNRSLSLACSHRSDDERAL